MTTTMDASSGTGIGTTTAVVGRQLGDVLSDAQASLTAGAAYSSRAWPTGLTALDRELAGGLRGGELVVLGGAQGLGKTTFALQLARNISASGGVAAYLCYEHDDRVLMQKLLAMEVGLLDPDAGATLRQVSDALRTTAQADDLPALVSRLYGTDAPLAAMRAYAERLRLVTGSARTLGLPQLRDVAASIAGSGVLVVDYLQKVPVPGPPMPEADRVTIVVEALKDLAMEFGVPVVAVCAADRDGIGEGRTRLAHMRGSTAIAYEADIALMLNDKWHAVARHHLMYGTGGEQFHDWVVCTVEKNRAGRAGVDLEFRKRFDQSRFEPDGGPVREELIDDRVFRE